MKILIHDNGTRLYYAGTERWTQHRAEAHDFKQSLSAIEYARSRSLCQAELIYDFDGERAPIVMPILMSYSPRKPGHTAAP